MGPDDPTTAELLLTLGLAEEDALRRAVEVQRAAAQLGLPESLFEIISKKKLLPERQAARFTDLVALERLAPTAIPGYRLVSRRGFAGIAVLFEATRLADGRPVLLKVLSPLVAAEEALARRFDKEVQTVSRLRHPNLPRLLHSDTVAHYRYFAVEGGGRFLADLIDQAPLPAAMCLDLAADLCRALTHLATLHLGVNPAAVIERDDGRWVLLDCGATPPPAERVATFPGVALADPVYGAPEVRRGATPGVQADIFSIGATVFAAATGRPPGLGETTAHEASLPQPLKAILEKAIAPDPANRFASPDELLAAVERARQPSRAQPAATPAAPTTPPPAPPELKPQARRSGLFWTAVFALLVLALVISGLRALYVRVLKPIVSAPGQPAATPEGPPAGGSARAKTPERAARSNLTSGEPATGEPRREDTPDQAARQAALAKDALDFDRAHPLAHAEALVRLRRALMATTDPAMASALEARRAARATRLDEAAGKAFRALVARTNALRQSDRFAEALKACEGFPPELRCGLWAQRRRALIETIGAAAEARYLALASGALLDLLRQRYDEALATYEQIARLGIPWMAEASALFLAAARPYAEAEKKRLAAINERRARYARRASFAPLQPHFAAIAALVAKRDHAGALAACAAIPQELRAGEPGQAVAHLEARLNAWADLWGRILKGPPAAIGQILNVYGNRGIIEGFSGKGKTRRLDLRIRAAGGERPISYLIKKLPPQAIRQLAELAARGMPPRQAALVLGLFSLCEGNTAQARADLREAAALTATGSPEGRANTGGAALGGADVQPFLDELEAMAVVRDAFAAVRDHQWVKARQLLETALDRHATAAAVIATHSKLTAALKTTLARLGRPAGPPVFVRAPLPDALRRLPLLPETRLQAHAPDDPLAAYLGKPLVRQAPVLAGFPTWKNYTVVVRWAGVPDADFLLAARVTSPQRGQFFSHYLALRGSKLSLWRLDAAGHHALKAVPAPALRQAGHHRLSLRLDGADVSVAADGRVVLMASDPQPAAGQVALTLERGSILVERLELYFHPGAR